PISRRIYSWVTSKSCSGALDTERAVVESRRFVMISPPDETRRRCISDRVPFPILKPVPRFGTIVENGGQTLRGDKPLFLGCNSLGHDALGASSPPPGAARCTKPPARRRHPPGGLPCSTHCR